MDRIIFLVCLFFATPCVGQTTWDIFAVGGNIESGACVAEYGPELNADDNASKPSASDTDATTGWTSGGLSVFDSISTDTPSLGTYHIVATADTAGDRLYKDLSTILTGDTLYQLKIDTKQDGSGGNFIAGLGASSSGTEGAPQVIATTETTYTNHDWYFVYNTAWRYLVFKSVSTGSLYVDNLTITPVTTPCTGDELYTGDAASASEVDGVSGWTGSNVDVLASVSTGTPKVGTYHVDINENAAPTSGAYAYKDIGTAYSLQDGHKYLLTCWVKHNGTGGVWTLGLSNAASTTPTPLYQYFNSTMTTYVKYGFSFTYSASYRYLVAKENSVTNDGGLYIDDFSIKEIISE